MNFSKIFSYSKYVKRDIRITRTKIVIFFSIILIFLITIYFVFHKSAIPPKPTTQTHKISPGKVVPIDTTYSKYKNTKYNMYIKFPTHAENDITCVLDKKKSYTLENAITPLTTIDGPDSVYLTFSEYAVLVPNKSTKGIKGNKLCQDIKTNLDNITNGVQNGVDNIKPPFIKFYFGNNISSKSDIQTFLDDINSKCSLNSITKEDDTSFDVKLNADKNCKFSTYKSFYSIKNNSIILMDGNLKLEDDKKNTYSVDFGFNN